MDAFDDFKFKIGDMVQLREAVPTELLRRPVKIAKVIVERVLQECHGGRQRIYYVRNGTALVPLTEVELEAYQEPAE